MTFWNLRTRIVFFFVALLAVVQLTAFVLVNAANSTNARHKIDTELAAGERIFARLLEQNRERLSQAVRLLAADYGFREAIASNDVGTMLSALNNHGSRIHADVTQLVSLDGSLLVDTQHPQRHGAPLQAFRFVQLLEAARQNGSASSIELIGGKPYQLVVVPVLGPLPIAWVVIGFSVDNSLANELRQLTSLEVSFVEWLPAKGWRVLASTLDEPQRASLAQELPDFEQARTANRIQIDDDEQQIKVINLGRHADVALIAVLQRSVATAIAAFDSLRRTLIGLGIISLVLSVIGSIAIALGITRPLGDLARAATRIQEGDYSTAVAVTRRDEIGVLAGSLNEMREGIAEREKEILRLAYQDTLTGLPNRAMFNERLGHAIENAKRTKATLSVLVMDLDRFKYVNDSLGHSVGDHVLKEVAARIQTLLRASDTIARLGGDEFAILLSTSLPEDIRRIAHKIARSLEEPFLYNEQPLDVGTSMGIAQYPEHGEDAGTLMRNADIAMYVAKRGKSGFAIYDRQYDTHQQEHLSLLGELRRAVQHDELQLYYQPKVSLANSTVDAVEALLRWDHPIRGCVSPAEFIPFAEHTGYIKVLTRWVMEEAFRQCGVWNAAGAPLRVSLNISARDLMNRDLPDVVSQLLVKHQVPGDLICLEITESGFMEDPVYAQRVLARLHDLGVHLSIDDYGTGYSSLSYIVQLPVDELKIDRSFVSEMMTDATTSMIVRSTIELGHNLGLKVVAEGVEDESGFKYLRQLGCDQAQGYFMSPPLPVEKLEAWLRTSPWGRRSSAQSNIPYGIDQSAAQLA